MTSSVDRRYVGQRGFVNKAGIIIRLITDTHTMKEGLWKEEAGYGKTPTPYFSKSVFLRYWLLTLVKISILGGG